MTGYFRRLAPFPAMKDLATAMALSRDEMSGYFGSDETPLAASRRATDSHAPSMSRGLNSTGVHLTAGAIGHILQWLSESVVFLVAVGRWPATGTSSIVPNTGVRRGEERGTWL